MTCTAGYIRCVLQVSMPCTAHNEGINRAGAVAQVVEVNLPPAAVLHSCQTALWHVLQCSAACTASKHHAQLFKDLAFPNPVSHQQTYSCGPALCLALTSIHEMKTQPLQVPCLQLLQILLLLPLLSVFHSLVFL